MPNITIREKDLTSAGNLEATTNAVYIPGYANMGPVNTPILCETVEDFKYIFGSTPYRFRTDQTWQFATDVWDANSHNDYMGNFYQAGDYEKSYIMAVGLLRAGIPVLYERVFNRGNYSGGVFADESAWTATVSMSDSSSGYTVASTTPGLAGSYVKIIVIKETCTLPSGSGDYYIMRVSREANPDFGIPKMDMTDTLLTFSQDVAKQMPSVKYVASNQIVVDNSGLVEFRFGTINSSYALTQSTISDGVYNATSLAIAQSDSTYAGGAWLDEFNVKDMYDYLCSTDVDASTGEQLGIERLIDNGEYAIKFITSGAYPTYGLQDVGSVKYSSISGRMIVAAAERGNATALVDHTPNNQRTLVATNASSVYYSVAVNSNGLGKVTRTNSLGEDANTFAAMFTPYGIYETTMGDTMLPASYGYLLAYAAQSQSTNNWLATAGCTRGYVPGLKALCQNVTNSMADSYQPRNGVAINAITNIKPYGLMIWGARTLKDNVKKGDLTATSFLNIRQLTNDVKRQVWVASKYLTFEQNNDLLWIKFKNKITPLLDNMINGNGISAYELKRQKTSKKATVKAVVRLYAIEPVEDWDITVELADSTTEILG